MRREILAVRGGIGRKNGGIRAVRDAPIVLVAGAPLDDAMLFGGGPPTSVSQPDPYTLAFGTSVYVSNTSPWEIARQPAWVATLLAQPVNGIFG